MTLSTGGRPRVAVFGTFDVENYGDLLFPLLARQALSDLDATIIPVSPTNRATGFRDALPPVSVAQIAADPAPLDAILIGGGNIIHLKDAALREYAQVPGTLAYPALWMGATLIGQHRHCPVIWNAPGVFDFDPETVPHGLVTRTLGAADYLSVRDAASASRLAAFGATPEIVPDTALLLDTLWPRSTLEAAFRDLMSRHGFDSAQPVLAVHVKARALGGLGISGMARQITIKARQLGLTPALIAIGGCHGDDAVVRDLSDALPIPHLALDHPRSLQDMAALLVGARASVVTSMHSFVTATAYQRPSVLVAVPALTKFAGFAGHVGRSDDVVPDWNSAFERLDALAANDWPAPPVPRNARDAVADHWTKLRTLIRARSAHAEPHQPIQHHLMDDLARHLAPDRAKPQDSVTSR